MISIEQINGEIAVLEDQVPTHTTMQKLAALYTVRDHMVIKPDSAGSVVSVPMETFDELGMSDFLQTIKNRSIKKVMLKMDELMSTVAVLNPKLYAGVMRDLIDES